MGSRVESILKAKSEGDVYDQPAQSRIEQMLLNMDFSSGGGGSSTNISGIKTDITTLKTQTKDIKNRIETLETYSILASDKNGGSDKNA